MEIDTETRPISELNFSIFPQPHVLEGSPVVCVEDHHVVQEAAGVVTQLVRSGHGAQHLLGHREEGTVLDKAEHLLLLLLNTCKLLLQRCKLIRRVTIRLYEDYIECIYCIETILPLY